MDLKKIVIGFIVLLVVIWIYRYFFTDPTSSTLLDYGDGKDTVVINSTKLSGNSAATDFTYSFWMYVNNWNYKLGKKKTIIRRQGNGGGLSPEIYLDNYSNDLVVNLEIYKNGETGDSGISENMIVSKITNIPLQKWTNINITTNNRSLDTYIDGKLVKTSLLPGPVKVDGTAGIEICPTVSEEVGFDGNIAKVRYYSRTMNPRESYEIYKEGYSGSLLGNLMNKYRVKFSFITDNKETASLEI
jgi:hypothetical protein